jgi:hypothetical protein
MRKLFYRSMLLVLATASTTQAVSPSWRTTSSVQWGQPAASYQPVTSYQAVPAQGAGAVQPVARTGSDAYSIALRSAQYRAANGIKGHCSIEMGRNAGVGWSSHDPNPRTCFWERRHQGSYASVRGADGWYSTLVLH